MTNKKAIEIAKELKAFYDKESMSCEENTEYSQALSILIQNTKALKNAKMPEKKEEHNLSNDASLFSKCFCESCCVNRIFNQAIDLCRAVVVKGEMRIRELDLDNTGHRYSLGILRLVVGLKLQGESYSEIHDKIVELKQQFAKKDIEITELRDKLNTNELFTDDLVSWRAEDELKMDELQQQNTKLQQQIKKGLGEV